MKKLNESSTIDTKLKEKFIKNGYKYLGQGKDQIAFIDETTNNVIKIFGTNGTTLSVDQKMFIVWTKFCEDRTNKFLPKIFNYKQFTFNKQLYLNISQEYLTTSGDVGYAIEDFCIAMYGFKSTDNLTDIIDDFKAVTPESYDLLFDLLGNDFKLLATTIFALYSICIKHGWGWDLHRDNVMMRGNIPVIVDPWEVK